jgi:hypothetical protein
MTLNSSIIQQALREANVIPIGGTPSTDEQAECLIRLQSLISSVYGSEVGENLFPWPLGNYGRSNDSRMWISEQQLRYPCINSTLVAVNEAAITAYLPTNPSDGARVQLIDPYSRLATYPVTINGNGRTIENAASVTISTGGTNRTWIFRGETGDWTRITDITYSGTLPFPREFDDYFVLMLALRSNPTYGMKMDDQSKMRLKQQRQQIMARYAQSAPLQINPDLGYALRQSYDQYADAWLGAANTQTWNQGGGWGWWGN